MKKKNTSYLNLLGLLLLLSMQAQAFHPGPETEKRSYYEIKQYHLKSDAQVQAVDKFLETAYLPALHRAGFFHIGVYHWMGNDTASEKRVYVFIPLHSLEDMNKIEELMLKDTQLQESGSAYWNAAYNESPFQRIETTVLKAFPKMPGFKAPDLKGNKTDRVYELRSYEGPTERLYRQKVDMFNNGGEIALFKRLQFNAVFYAEVIAGSHMPNLMYMTSFDNQASRDAHWKAFGSDPEWVRLKELPQYLNTVSRADIQLLHPTEFSEL